MRHANSWRNSGIRHSSTLLISLNEANVEPKAPFPGRAHPRTPGPTVRILKSPRRGLKCSKLCCLTVTFAAIHPCD